MSELSLVRAWLDRHAGAHAGRWAAFRGAEFVASAETRRALREQLRDHGESDGVLFVFIGDPNENTVAPRVTVVAGRADCPFHEDAWCAHPGEIAAGGCRPLARPVDVVEPRAPDWCRLRSGPVIVQLRLPAALMPTEEPRGWLFAVEQGG